MITPGSFGQVFVAPAAGYTIPVASGTSAVINPVKARINQVAGVPNMLVEGGTFRGATLNWGTLPSDSPASTAVTATATQVESGGGHLQFQTRPDGVQSYAMGRILKFPNGPLRMMHYAGDALFSSSPRCQMFLYTPIPRSGYWRFYVSPQFGDSQTPWPAYVVSRDSVLFWQFKGTATQPSLAFVVDNDPANLQTLRIRLNSKPTNAGGITTLHTITGLTPGVRYDLVLDTFLDFVSGRSYIGLWFGGKLVYETTTVNTLMSDIDDSPQPMWGIYRYQYSAVQAPDDCAIVFHQAATENASVALTWEYPAVTRTAATNRIER